MALTGTGWVAILSDGPPVLLNVATAPTFADAAGRDHVVLGRARPRIKTDFKMKNLIGQRLGRDASRWPSPARAGCSSSRPRAGWRPPSSGGGGGGGGLSGNLSAAEAAACPHFIS